MGADRGSGWYLNRWHSPASNGDYIDAALAEQEYELASTFLPMHLTTMSMWIESLRILPNIPHQLRVSFCNGLALGFMGTAVSDCQKRGLQSKTSNSQRSVAICRKPAISSTILSVRVAWPSNGICTARRSAKVLQRAFGTAWRSRVTNMSRRYYLSKTGDHRFQSIWTQLRTPAVALPTDQGPNGLPVSIQLVAPPYADARLLASAQLVFSILGRKPVIAM